MGTSDVRHRPSPEGQKLIRKDKLSTVLAQIDTLFEPSPALHIALSASPHQVLAEVDEDGNVTPDLIYYVVKVLHGMTGKPELDEILNCHPRLGSSKPLSVHSSNEQASLSDGVAGQKEAAQLQQLNDEYEKTFPGLRYVVFVNGRPRSVIMHNMKDRIARNDIKLEREEGIQAMRDIALDRLKKVSLPH